MSENRDLRVDGARLWRRHMEMAKIGATPAGGCNRQALTDEDQAGRDLFIAWARAIGCTIRIDQIGNIFARRPGLADELPPVVMGSHLDTQPTGGRFDGVFGVLAGLEVLETLLERGVVTRRPLEVVSWTNEEGSRFTPGCVGSSVFAGAMSLEAAYALRDAQGRQLGDALARIGYRGDESALGHRIAAYLEPHIEQGPILEKERRQIGILSGIIGLRWYDLILHGLEAHAGPTPMEDRTDPWRAALPILEGLYALAAEHAPWGRFTIGTVRAEPGSRNTVPGRLVIGVDLRHPEAHTLKEIDLNFRALACEVSERMGIRHEIMLVWDMPPTVFDPRCVEAIRAAASELGYPSLDMFSGAGHDAVFLARVAPTAMLFIPCEKGLSHNEAENVQPADLEAGANVLLHAAMRLADS